jgi:hypothetical protein
LPSSQPLQQQGIPAIPCQANKRKKLSGQRQLSAVNHQGKQGEGRIRWYVLEERTRKGKDRKEGKERKERKGRKGFNTSRTYCLTPINISNKLATHAIYQVLTFQGFFPASRRIVYTAASNHVKQKNRDFETFIVTS